MARKTRQRKKEKRFIQKGKAYISATFNNTIITLTDETVMFYIPVEQVQLGSKGQGSLHLLLLKELLKV